MLFSYAQSKRNKLLYKNTSNSAPRSATELVHHQVRLFELIVLFDKTLRNRDSSTFFFAVSGDDFPTQKARHFSSGSK